MFAALPIAFLLLIWPMLAAALAGQPEGDKASSPSSPSPAPPLRPGGWVWAEALLAAATVTALGVVFSTELLSLFHAIDQFPLMIFWCLALLAALTLGLTKPGFARPPRPSLAFLSPLNWFERGVLLLVILIVLALGAVALVAIPDTWDSMTYHLGRVAHWIANRSVAFYPTSIMRQNHQGPLAERIILQLRLLSGSWQCVNLVQWAAMAGSLLAVALLARRFGGSPRARLWAVVFAVTLPMGILQATSTQNDHVAAFWLLCFIIFGLQALDRPSPWRLALMAAALALGLLTKGTMYFFAFPFVVWFGVALLLRMRLKAWQPALISLAVVLAVNGGHYTRNWKLYRNPLGSDREIVNGEQFVYASDIHGPRATLSTLARNAAIHLGLPLSAWNRGVVATILGFHKLIGADPNDPRTTWLHESFEEGFSGNENGAGNPLHFLGLGAAVALLLAGVARRQVRPVAPLLIHLGCLLGAAVFFCAMLRWQPWHSRLHLPLFLAAAPLAGCVLAGGERSRGRWAAWALMSVLLLAALPSILDNPSRPMLGQGSVFAGDRRQQLIMHTPAGMIMPALELLKKQGCTRAGLLLDGDEPEFPFWLLKDELLNARLEFVHVGVTNVSRSLGDPGEPMFVLSLRPQRPRVATLKGKPYDLVGGNELLSVYKAR